jgi:uncharacterized membrane protein
MSSTPVSALNRLRPLRGLLSGLVVLVLALTLALTAGGVRVAWLALPLAAWAGVLLVRPGMPDAKRAVLFLTGTGLALTLFVEVAVLRGDIGRMNTVFKFYLQAWTLLSLSAAAAALWLFNAPLRAWRPGWRAAWLSALVVLVGGAALFPLLAGVDKMTDRMANNAPHTLDGMTYMAYSTYVENERVLDLSEDYRAIRWMQENVPGSPVIVEAHQSEYRWGNRYTIYTGLPGVVGWNWHQRQQRAVAPQEWVFQRVDSIGMFYNTVDRTQVERFLRQYDVRYIIVGQLERGLYSADGLAKFDRWEDAPWIKVYQDGQTAIYAVQW